MHVNISKQTSVGGYVLLAAILFVLVFLYIPQMTFATPHFWETVLAASATIAMISVTVANFLLWDTPLSDKLEIWLGPVGHIFHCGYCQSLWLSAGATTLFGLAFFPSMPPAIDFFFSWWALGTFTIIIHEIIGIGWFQKIEMIARKRERSIAQKNAGT